MNAIGYEIKVIKSTSDKTADRDLTKPYQTKTGGAEYFVVEVLAKCENINGVKIRRQRKPFVMVVNSSIDKIMFNDLLDALGSGTFTKAESGLKVTPSEFGIAGNIVERKVDGVYKVLLPDGTPLKITQGPHAGEDATRSVVRVFVASDEEADVVVGRAIDRIPEEAWIKANANDDSEVDEKK